MAFLAENGLSELWELTKEYANNATDKIELVWENASPTSDFAAQTINLDLNGADGVFIVVKNDYRSVFIPKNLFDSITSINRWMGANTGYRNITVSTSGIAFSDGLDSRWGNTPVPSYVIPLYIYKVIKGVRA